MNLPFVSIIIPCRNEAQYIDAFLTSIANFDYDKKNFEVLISDGLSDDDTVKKILDFNERSELNISLFENTFKTVPFALNQMIDAARGDYIIRLDVHAKYPPHYIKTLINCIIEQNVQNVGGKVITLPANNSGKALAIAKCSSHKFGVGNSQFRIENNTNNTFTEVDTVPFGCFQKDIFDKVGLFDTDLTRNQDDEFNARIIKNGGKILMINNLKLEYYARPDWSKMRKMFYQYGLFKPLSNKKLGKVSTIRQLVPPIFVLFLFLGWLPAIFWLEWFLIYSLGLIMYVLVCFYFSSQITKRITNIPLYCLTFFQIHLSYGLGYWKGVLKFIILNQNNSNNIKQNS